MLLHRPWLDDRGLYSLPSDGNLSFSELKEPEKDYKIKQETLGKRVSFFSCIIVSVQFKDPKNKNEFTIYRKSFRNTQ